MIQAAERGTDTYECTHTNIASHGGEELRALGHYTPASEWPDQHKEAWSDHRGPVTRQRRKPREADGGVE